MKIIFIIILLFNLIGCGFHLRGHETLSPQFQRLYIQSENPYSMLTKQLQQMLHASGIVLTSTAKDAPVTLQILSDSNNRQVTSQGVSGQLATYLLSYKMNYQLLDVNGNIIREPRTITAARNYVVSSNQILGDINVQQNLQNDMRRDVINQLLQQLKFPSAPPLEKGG